MLKLALISAVALAAAAAFPAASQPFAPSLPGIEVHGRMTGDVTVVQKTIDIHDIDVNTPDGARRLYWRVNDAADLVCAPGPDGIHNLRELAAYIEFHRCKHDSIRLALSYVHSAAVTDFVTKVHER
jgi:UrcA family protein